MEAAEGEGVEEASICKRTSLRTKARSQQQGAREVSTAFLATQLYARKEEMEEMDASELTFPRVQPLETLCHNPTWDN